MNFTLFAPTVLSLLSGLFANGDYAAVRAAAAVRANRIIAAATASWQDLSAGRADAALAEKMCPYCNEGDCLVCHDAFRAYGEQFDEQAHGVNAGGAVDAANPPTAEAANVIAGANPPAATDTPVVTNPPFAPDTPVAPDADDPSESVAAEGTGDWGARVGDWVAGFESGRVGDGLSLAREWCVDQASRARRMVLLDGWRGATESAATPGKTESTAAGEPNGKGDAPTAAAVAADAGNTQAGAEGVGVTPRSAATASDASQSEAEVWEDPIADDPSAAYARNDDGIMEGEQAVRSALRIGAGVLDGLGNAALSMSARLNGWAGDDPAAAEHHP